jgi:hypothetical protein
MSKPKIFYHPIDGSAPLTATFSEAPKGDAVEAKNEAGVGFFSPAGELLSVVFDDVQENDDHQSLLFQNYRVDVATHQSKVKVEVADLRKSPKRGRTGKAA